MAVRALNVEELRELIAVLADALGGALMEIDQIEDEPRWEASGDLLNRMVERYALKQAFARLPEGELRGKLRTIYKEELSKASDLDDDALEVPEVHVPSIERGAIEDALVRLDAAMLFDSELYAVVRRDATSVR